MDILLSTGCLYKYSLPEIFGIAKEVGFDGIELLIGQNSYNVGIDHIQELSDEYNIPILGIHSPFIICDGWGGFWDRIWRSLIMAMELQIPLVNFHPPSGLIFRYYLNDEISEHIRICRDMIGDSGIVVTIENLPTIRTLRRLFINRFFPRMINNIRQIAEFAVNNGIYVTFDTTHIGTTGIDLLEAYAIFGDTIANIHLSDYDGRSQHLLPGMGYLPLEKLLVQVKRDGYRGTITLETCPAAMEHEDKAKAARNAEAGLKYIRNVLREGE